MIGIPDDVVHPLCELWVEEGAVPDLLFSRDLVSADDDNGSLAKEVCQQYRKVRVVVSEPGVGETGPEDSPKDLKCYQKGSLQAVSSLVVADDGLPDQVLLPERLQVTLCERGWRRNYQEYFLLLLALLPHLSSPGLCWTGSRVMWWGLFLRGRRYNFSKINVDCWNESKESQIEAVDE